MRLSIIALFFSLLCSFPITSEASHQMGSTITYRAIDSLVLEISIEVYRDCRGVGQGNQAYMVSDTGYNYIINQHANLVSITKIRRHCSTSSNYCSPSNTSFTGNGIEKHVYIDTIDLTKSIFDSLKNICNIRLSYRNTTPTFNNLYQVGTVVNYTDVNLCVSAYPNSPVFSEDWHYKVYCNQSLRLALLAVDSISNDSLSYHFVPTLEDTNSIALFKTGLTYINPFDAYYPGNWSPPYSDPYSNPPKGIYLDSKSGYFAMSPTNCAQYGYTTVEIKQWKKDSNGNHSIYLGSVRRGLTIQTSSTTNYSSSTLLIDGDSLYNPTYNICTSDSIVIRIDGYSSSNISLHLHNKQPGAKLSQVSTSQNHSIAYFSFAPPKGTMPGSSFYFGIELLEDQCPFQIKTNRIIKINVISEPENCNSYKKLNDSTLLVDIFDHDKVYSYSYTRKIFQDSVSINTSSAKFKKTSNSSTYFKSDTLSFTDVSKLYIVRTVANSNFGLCSYVFIDTIVLDSFPEIEILNTDSSICVNQSDTIFSSSRTNLHTSLRYQWAVNNTILKDEKQDYLTYHLASGSSSKLFTVTVFDRYNRISIDSFRVYPLSYDYEKLKPLYYACDTVFSIMSDTNLVSFSWSDGSSQQTISITQDGIYSLEAVDTFGCFKRDTTQVLFKEGPNLSVSADTAICKQFAMKATSLDSNLSYFWSNNLSGPQSVTDSSGVFYVTAMNIYGCTTIDSTEVTIYSIPVLNLIDSSSCSPEVEITSPKNASYSWSTGATSRAITVDTAGFYYVDVLDSNGCFNSDTVEIGFYIPEQAKLKDTSQCGGLVKLTSNIIGSSLWSTGSALHQILTNTSGKFWLQTIDSNGCMTSDTAQVNIFDLPDVQINDSSQCGGSIKVDAGNFLSYEWNTGDTTRAITVSSSGTYIVTVNDTNNCYSSNSAKINIFSIPNSGIEDTTICGDSIILKSNSYDSTIWFDGSTYYKNTISSNGKYYIRLVSNDGCSQIDSFEVTLNRYPIIPINDTAICGDSYTINPGVYDSYLWNNGDTSALLTIVKTGYYAVSVKDSNNCTSDGSAYITLNPVLHPNIDTAKICQDSAQVIGTSGAANYLWSNSRTDRVTHFTTTGKHWIRVGTNKNCYTSDTFYVIESKTNLFDLNDTAHCGDSALIGPNTNDLDYYWATGETYSPRLLKQSGYYTLTASDNNGCSANRTFYLNLLKKPLVNLGPDIVQCGGSYTLNAGTFERYLWNTSDTTQTIDVSESGLYSVKITNKDKCTARDTVIANIIEHDKPVISKIQDSLYSSFNYGNQWFRNDIKLDGFTNKSIKPNIIGKYSVQHTDSFDCISPKSDYFNIDFSGIANITDGEYIVYPQPCNNRIHIKQLNTDIRINKIELFALDGRVVPLEINRKSSEFELRWNAASGTYLLRIFTANGVQHQKIVNIN